MIIRSEINHGRKRAFSLVEVMVTTLLVATMFIVLFTGLSQGFSVTAASTERLRANQIMLERIEGIRLVMWSDLANPTLVPLTFTNYYYPLAAGGESRGIPYTGTVTIAPTDLGAAYSGTNDMKKLTVTVDWTTGTRARTESLTTFVSRNGLQRYVFYK